MKAANIEAWLERGYREGGKFQWLRETAVNGIEAAATRIEYGVEWQAVEKLGVYRRLIADNGRGMDAEDLVEFMRTMGGGGKPVGDEHANFGVGAKTSLCPWNKRGVVVVSWHQGYASMIQIVYDAVKDEYGLLEVEDDAGNKLAVYTPYIDENGIDWEAIRPDWMKDQDGTVIVLLGQHLREDTVRGDPGREEDGTKNVAAYLNRRFWRLDRTLIQAVEFTGTDRSDWPKTRPNGRGLDSGIFTRTVRGAEHYILGQHMKMPETSRLEQGSLEIDQHGTRLDWYLWTGEKPRTYHYAPATGFIAVMYDGELYNQTTHSNTFRSFGIGSDKVKQNLWLIIKPIPHDKEKKAGVYPRGDRNGLFWHAGRNLPTAAWSDYFCLHMPQPIVRALREARGETTGAVDDESLRQRLAARYATMWQIPRRRHDPRGGERASADALPSFRRGQPNPDPSPTPRVKPSKPKRPQSKRIFALEGDDVDASATRVKGGLPRWEILREPLDEDDLNVLAVYTKPSEAERSGLVQLYGEHPVILRMVEILQGQYAPAFNEDVRNAVEQLYAQVAACRVAHSYQLGTLFNETALDEMRSARSLTFSLLGMAAEEAYIREYLASTLKTKRIRTAAEAAA
jgi:hypothetical protein